MNSQHKNVLLIRRDEMLKKSSNNRYYLDFPITFVWNITKRCNLRCKHCFVREYSVEPSFEQVKNIINYLGNRNVAGISITGGEPFIREDILEIIELIIKKGIKVQIATNGTLINEKQIEHLNQLGIDRYQISLDGHNAQQHDAIRGEGTFSKAVETVKTLNQYNERITIACVLNKQNYKFAPKVIELARNLDIDLLKFELFLPIGIDKAAELVLDKESLVEINYTLGMQKNSGIEIDNPFEVLAKGCDVGYFSAVINEDMTVSPCDLLAEVIRTRPMNNVEDLEVLWRSDEAFLDWRSIRISSPHCTSCDFFSECKFGCRAAAFAFENDISGYDNICLYKDLK